MNETRDERTLATISLGAMNFGGRTPEPESRAIVARAIERGVARIDTANVYGDGVSERIVGQSLAALSSTARDRIEVATKVGLRQRGRAVEGLSRAAIERACDESLTNLGVDAIDLYYLHAPHPSTPLDETLDAIADLLEKKRIRAWGVSNFAAWQIVEIALRCDARSMPRPIASQVLYNLLVRQLDVDYFACARRYPLRTVVYNALAGGLLARQPSHADAPPKGSRFDRVKMYQRRYWTEPMTRATARYAAIAGELGTTLPTMAYRWLVGRAGVDSILVGPATLEHLDFALDACALPLDAAAMKRIDETHEALVGTNAQYAR